MRFSLISQRSRAGVRGRKKRHCKSQRGGGGREKRGVSRGGGTVSTWGIEVQTVSAIAGSPGGSGSEPYYPVTRRGNERMPLEGQRPITFLATRRVELPGPNTVAETSSGESSEEWVNGLPELRAHHVIRE